MRISDWSSDVCSSDLEFSEGSGPSLFTVSNDNCSIGWFHLLSDSGELLNIFTFYGIAYSCTAHENVHSLIEATQTIYGEVGAIVSRDVTTIKSRTTSHEGSHRSDKRRVGKGGVSTCRSRWKP